MPICRYFSADYKSAATPGTVANFLAYVNAGAYDNSIIHRSTSNDPAQVQIIQGGAFQLVGNTITWIPTDSPIPNEPGLSNLRGTIAMAKVGGNPDSATSQWFFNVQDNPDLDLAINNGGYTVFGQVVDANGLASLDAIAGLGVYNWNPKFGLSSDGPFGEIPLIYGSVPVIVDSVAVVPEPSTWALAAIGALLAAFRSRGSRAAFRLPTTRPIQCGGDLELANNTVRTYPITHAHDFASAGISHRLLSG